LIPLASGGVVPPRGRPHGSPALKLGARQADNRQRLPGAARLLTAEIRLPRPLQHVRISSILLDAGVVTAEQIDAALARQLTTGLKIGETLVELGAVTEEDIGWALARQLQLPFVDPRPETLDRELLQSFPAGMLQRLDAVPLVRDESGLAVAVSDPLDVDMVRDLEQAGRRPLRLSVATPSAIRRVLRDVLGVAREARGPSSKAGSDSGSWDRSGASFLQLQLAGARRVGANEIHFLPRAGSLDVFHRVGTRLVPAGSEPSAALGGLLTRLEDLGCPMAGERHPHARGRLTCAVGHESIALDVSLLGSQGGVSVVLVLSVVPPRHPLLEDLGLDPVDLASLRGALERPAGLGIVMGPPRSGGSTTLECLTREAATPERRVLTLGGAAELGAHDSAQAWLEAAALQSADVVVMDPLDGEALTGALGTAASGRLLLARTDGTETFSLLEQLGSRPRHRAALTDRLRFVVQQRLLWSPPGNEDARPRWQGRRALFEVLLPGDSLRGAIRRGGSAEDLRAAAERDGFQTMAQRFQTLVELGQAEASDASRIEA
jgi:MSHA biogenesis protein MshE